MHWSVYSLCPYGNVKLCTDWFAMQCTFSRTVWRHGAEQLKQWSKLQIAQRFLECINQPVPHGEILLWFCLFVLDFCWLVGWGFGVVFCLSVCFYAIVALNMFPKGFSKTILFRPMKRVAHSVLCCSKGTCGLQNLILGTDMSHLTCIDSFTHS